MPAKDNITLTTNITVNPREVDFVTKFGDNWHGLLDIIGVSNMIEKAPGTQMYVRKGGITLASSPAEGELIPLSSASVTEVSIGTIEIKKYAKEVTLESIEKYGYDVAIEKTDKAFANKLRGDVMDKFYDFLATGTLSASASTVQMGLSLANGNVRNAFDNLNLDITGIVGFCNIMDFYEYLGGASITVQNEFGYNYVKNFLGYDTLFLCSSEKVAKGTIYCTAIENIIGYYVNPSNSDFARAGLNFTTDVVTPIIGVHVEGDYDYAGSKMTAIHGIVLSAEYLSGICVCTISA